jgi:hypothetical protein
MKNVILGADRFIGTCHHSQQRVHQHGDATVTVKIPSRASQIPNLLVHTSTGAGAYSPACQLKSFFY